MGTFPEKEAKKLVQSKIWRRSPHSVVSKMGTSVVPDWEKINRMARSMNTDPSRVYRKN
jgi:hypothetical protein